MIGGVLVDRLGIFLLSQMHAAPPRWDLAWRMAVLGIGWARPEPVLAGGPERHAARAWAW
jgi:hypothetical protein